MLSLLYSLRYLYVIGLIPLLPYLAQGGTTQVEKFVRNRVSEIQELTSPSNWYHCLGKDNPADLISRGALAEHLVSSELWLNEPIWLSIPSQHPSRSNIHWTVWRTIKKRWLPFP